MAGSFASVMTNPLDIVKLRMQVQRAEGYLAGDPHSTSKFGYKNLVHGIYVLTKKEGFLSLYKGKFAIKMTLINGLGSLARCLYHTPATAISMGLLEYIRNIVSKVMY